MNNAVFGKTMENVRKHRDIKLVTTDKRRNQLVSRPNYHTTKWFSKNLVAIEMKKTKVKMNKPAYLGLPILEFSETLMYEFWNDYMKPKYGDNGKLCYMDTDSFIMHIKTEDFYKDIANDVEQRFDTSNYKVNTPLPRGKNKKVTGLKKDELGGKIMMEFVALRPKTYPYLTDDCKEDKKAKGTKKCVIQRRLKFNDYKDCLLNKKIVLKSQQRFKSERNVVYTEDYSPLGKAFEKQTKTIEDQGKKQIDALADLKPKEIKLREIKPNRYSDYFIDEIAKIRKSHKPVDFINLIYYFKDSKIPSISFSKFKGPLHTFKSIHKGNIPLEDVEKEQIEQ